MANKKTTPKDTRKVLFARLPEPIYNKLQKLTARRSAKRGERITLQDTIIELIQGATT